MRAWRGRFGGGDSAGGGGCWDVDYLEVGKRCSETPEADEDHCAVGLV